MNIYSEKEKNVDYVKNVFSKGNSLVIRNFKIGGKIDCALVFLDELTDKETINRDIIKPVMEFDVSKVAIASNFYEILEECVLYTGECESYNDMNKTSTILLDGNVVLFIEGCQNALFCSAKSWSKRSVEEPPVSSVLRGPREGFNEDLKTNMSLIRRRLKTPDLTFNIIQVGKYSGTKIAVTYINSIADENIVNSICEKIQKIDIDGILDSAYVEAFLCDDRSSMFQQVGATEKPDIAVGKMLEGRVCVIVDGSPAVLSLPFLFIENFQDSGDYYDRPFRKNFLRILRFISFFMAILLPGLYVSMLLYHYEMLPIEFMLTIINARQGIPMDPMLEIIITMLLFEILQEASIRMPRFIGAAISIVGGLVLGETAVKAGIISSPAVLVSAISAIAIYNVPEQSGIMNMLRFGFTFLAGFIGIFGIIVGTVVVSLHLLKLTSVGIPYLAPYAPLYSNDKQDALLIKPVTQRFLRPESIPTFNRTRMRHKN